MKVDDAGFFTDPNLQDVTCPEGKYDGYLCYLSPAPAGEFIFANGFHATPENGVCPFNMIFDGANCFWRRAAFGTTAISFEGGWYTTARPSCSLPSDQPGAAPLLGQFDGETCRVAARSNLETEHLIVNVDGQSFAAARQP